MRSKNLIDIYIMEILEKYSNKDHKMTQDELIGRLSEYPYEITVHRNTLRSYLNELRDCGYIKGERGIYSINRFSDQELRLLIDGVLFGQHIPKNVAKNLIEKLKGMSELGLKDRIRHVHYLAGINRAENDNLYEMIDAIDEAIQIKRQIKVIRCVYDVTKKLVPSASEYILDPYYLVTEKSKYYLICHVTKNGEALSGLRNLRVDRFKSVEILPDNIALDIKKIPECKNGFQLDEYMRQHLYMLSGKTIPIEMKIKKKSIGDFIDWYGKDFIVTQESDDEVTIRFRGSDTAIKFWALQYGEIATITSPESLKKQIQEEIELLSKKYL